MRGVFLAGARRMTYCLAVKVDGGLVFASDSRSNAGVDYVTTYSKMHTFGVAGERLFVLLTAGNLATSQAVINQLQRDIDTDQAVNLHTVDYLFDAAHYIGSKSVQAQALHRDAAHAGAINVEASFILGGQIAGRGHDIYLIYPQGNYIAASPETPFLQIGETKYGKPILDRIISPATRVEDAARCALVSLDSTMRSNISVGPPIELALYRKDAHALHQRLLLKADAPLFVALQREWTRGLEQAFRTLPRFEWE